MEKFEELIIEEKTIKEAVITNPEILSELCTQLKEEKQVTVHCTFNLGYECRIRLWRSTYLIDSRSAHRSSLLHVIGIPVFPDAWIRISGVHTFTLFFSGLPKDCNVFDLQEFATTDFGSFTASGIVRNSCDVYSVNLSVNRKKY
jgi:hypothetical protein